jgi:signal transduction histidine kinase/CheY-like chemotaxis protein
MDSEREVLEHLESIQDRTDVPDDVKQTLRALSVRLQLVQRLESLGDLASGVAHEFNNLLMGVVGNADLVLDDLPPDAPARELVEEIQQAGQRAASLSRQMLAFSGKGRFTTEPVNLSKLVQDALPLLRAALSRHTTLETELPVVPQIVADPHRLAQAAVNLVRNASEASTGAATPVRLRTGFRQLDEAFLSTAALVGAESLRPGPHLYLEVEDSGCGMDAETRARMFDPHFSTKVTGRGLGLAATLGVVRAHHGAIDVQSASGKGTTVRIWLPCEAVDRPTPTQPSPQEAQRGVLLVDDEPYVRNIGTHALTRAGYTVVTASDGQQALARFKEQAGLVAVILDATMPKMSSEEVLREIHRQQPDLPVLLSSGYSEREVSARFEGLTWAGFIQKPYRPTELVSTVGKLLKRPQGR